MHAAAADADPWSSGNALEYQLQLAVPAEDLRARSLRGLQRVQTRVATVLGLADIVVAALEPRGWRVVAIRFDHEVAVVLARRATAAQVAGDLLRLPECVRAALGD